MNPVELDDAALSAEAAAALAGAPDTHVASDSAQADGAGAPGGSPAGAPAGESWAGVIESITPLLKHIVLAQWDVTDDQWRAWEQGLTRSMDSCFPGGIEGKYGGFVQAGLIAAGVTVANYVTRGALPPFGPPRRNVPKERQPDTAGAAS